MFIYKPPSKNLSKLSHWFLICRLLLVVVLPQSVQNRMVFLLRKITLPSVEIMLCLELIQINELVDVMCHNQCPHTESMPSCLSQMRDQSWERSSMENVFHPRIRFRHLFNSRPETSWYATIAGELQNPSQQIVKKLGSEVPLRIVECPCPNPPCMFVAVLYRKRL
jgi:hypothetical protein